MLFRGKRLRTEQKYYLHLHDYISLRSKLAQQLQLDSHSIDVDGYNIRSLYFDDPKNTSLERKNDGIFKREKFRIRIYNESDDFIALERKTKLGDYVCKESKRISRAEYDQIMLGEYEFLKQPNEPLLMDFYAAINTYGYKPMSIVDYWREAYIYEYGNVRITFDKRLAAGVNTTDLFDPQLALDEVVTSSSTIMEVKYDEMLPERVRQIIAPASSVRSSISKYVLCREKILQHYTQ